MFYRFECLNSENRIYFGLYYMLLKFDRNSLKHPV